MSIIITDRNGKDYVLNQWFDVLPGVQAKVTELPGKTLGKTMTMISFRKVTYVNHSGFPSVDDLKKMAENFDKNKPCKSK